MRYNALFKTLAHANETQRKHCDNASLHNHDNPGTVSLHLTSVLTIMAQYSRELEFHTYICIAVLNS